MRTPGRSRPRRWLSPVLAGLLATGILAGVSAPAQAAVNYVANTPDGKIRAGESVTLPGANVSFTQSYVFPNDNCTDPSGTTSRSPSTNPAGVSIGIPGTVLGGTTKSWLISTNEGNDFTCLQVFPALQNFQVAPKAELSSTPRADVPLSVNFTNDFKPSVADGTTFTYNWQVNGASVSTASTYTPKTADVGKSLFVLIVAKSSGYRNQTFGAVGGGTIQEGNFSDFTPVISGSGKPGEELTVAEPTGVTPTPTSWTYRWTTPGERLARSTSKSFTPNLADVGKTVTVTVTAKGTEGAPADKSATDTRVIVDGAGFTGDLKVGGTLSFPPSRAATLEFFSTDQCEDSTTVALENGTTSYDLDASRAGQYVQMIENNIAGDCLGPIAKGTLDDFTSVTLDGDVKGGEKVTAIDPTDVPAGTTFTYAWSIGERVLSTEKSYTIPGSIVEKKLVLTITAKADGYEDKSVSSEAMPIANGTLPSVTGTISDSTPETAPTTGDVLTLTPDTGVTLPEDTTTKWAWGHADDLISRGSGTCRTDGPAGQETYTVTNDDAGQTICAVVTTSAIGYDSSVTEVSADDTAVGTFSAPTITFDQAPQVGVESKPVVTGLDPEGDATYSWKVDGTEVSTDEAYEPTPADAGKAITVTVTNTKDDFIDDVSTSDETTVKKGVFTIKRSTISGTPKVGQVLTRTSLEAPEKPADVTYTYQWGVQLEGEDDCLAIGASATTLTLPRASAGARVCVITTGHAPGYKDAVSVSDLTGVVDGGDLTVFRPTISDTTPEVGDTLTASVSREGFPQDATVDFLWGYKVTDEDGVSTCAPFQRSGTDTYTVKLADGGRALCVVVRVKATGYNTAQASSRFTSVVTKKLMGAVSVSISDTTPTFGDTLTATTTGDGIPAGATKSYQWGVLSQPVNDGPSSGGPGSGGPVPATCEAIEGATGSTFEVPADLSGEQLCVTVTVTAEGYEDATATSDVTDAVVAKSLGDVTVSISDTSPTFGDTLTASVSGSDIPAENKVAFVWGQKIDGLCVTTEGPTGSTYEVGTADIGNQLCVKASVSAEGYEPAKATSDFTDAVVAATLDLGTPVISDTTPTFEDVLTATVTGAPEGSTTTWSWGTFNTLTESCDVAPIISIQRSAQLEGLDPSSHTVTSDEVGLRLCVVATVTADGYEQASTTSDPTDVVTAKSFTEGEAFFKNAPTVGLFGGAAIRELDPEPTSKTYVWTVDGTQVSTEESYKPVAADAEKAIVLEITASRAGYEDRVLTAEGTVEKGTFEAAVPTISDLTPEVGQTLDAAVDLTNAPEGATATFQWGRFDDGCSAIDGATGSSYRVPANLENGRLCVTVVVSAPGYEDAAGGPAATDEVTVGFFEIPTVTIDDTTPVVGQTLTADVDLSGLDLVSTPSVSYRWGTHAGLVTRGSSCDLFDAEPSATYTAAASDVTKQLCVVATVSADGYNSVYSHTSTEVVGKGVTTIGKPTIVGSPKVGKALTATGPAVPSGGTAAYYWGTAAAGATTCTTSTTAAVSFTPKATDLGKTVCVVAKVTGMDAYEDATSAASFSSRIRETAAVTLNDYTIKKGQKFTISATDLAPGQKYSIEVYDTKLTGTAGANGRISRTYTYPVAAASKTRKITVAQVSGKTTTYRKAVYLTYTK